MEIGSIPAISFFRQDYLRQHTCLHTFRWPCYLPIYYSSLFAHREYVSFSLLLGRYVIGMEHTCLKLIQIHQAKQVLNFDISMAVMAICRIHFQCSGTKHYSVVDHKEIQKPFNPNVYKYSSDRFSKITFFLFKLTFYLAEAMT